MEARILLTLSLDVASAMAGLGWFFTGQTMEVVKSDGSEESLRSLASRMMAVQQSVSIVLVSCFDGFNSMFPRDWHLWQVDVHVVALVQFCETQQPATTSWTFHVVPLQDIHQDGFYGRLFPRPM